MKQWSEELFENFSESYDREVYTQGTVGEVDFFEAEVGFDKTTRILDVGCGTGRHSIELARRGYQVTGIDLSEDQLASARSKAAQAGVNVNFIRKDARDFSFNDGFGLVIMICEGAFSLMETDEMNFRILANACNALNPGGKLIFTTLNALFPLYHSVKDFLNSNSDTGISGTHSFDLMTFRETSTYETVDDSGNKKVLHCNERYYIPTEISWMLKSLGMTEITILGSRLGAFSRNDRLTTDDFEMLVVARKPLTVSP